jgi:hypothetical protein
MLMKSFFNGSAGMNRGIAHHSLSLQRSKSTPYSNEFTSLDINFNLPVSGWTRPIPWHHVWFFFEIVANSMNL